MTTRHAALVALSRCESCKEYGEEIPTTQNDPATLAFSAVEDALKDSVFAGLDQPERRRRAPADKAGPAPDPARQPRAAPSASAPPTSIAAQTGSVANDDRFQGSRILYGLQSKSLAGARP